MRYDTNCRFLLTHLHAPEPRMITLGLTEVDIHRALDVRPEAPPDYGREHHALDLLAADLADDPRRMLQTLADAALDLCDAETAILSVRAGNVCRWEGVAGAWAGARGSAIPIDESPSAMCIERDATLLLNRPDRLFPAIRLEPRIVEALLVPFHAHGAILGTIWIAAHSPARQFTRGHERILRTLESFASAACQLRASVDEAADMAGRQRALFATLGHELRGPLGVITTAASVLQQRPLPEQSMTRAAGAIARQCTFITRLADDLLDAGRIGTGKMHLQLEAVDVRTAILEGIEMCRPKLADRNVELRMELPPSAVMVVGDRVRLVQMLANLLDNAAKYTPSGGHVRIGCASRPGQAELWVSDTGQGIAADQLSRIFEPFTQGRGSSADGLGLGLALVRELVQLHHGHIDVKSEGTGLGSRFTVRLPLSSPTS